MTCPNQPHPDDRHVRIVLDSERETAIALGCDWSGRRAPRQAHSEHRALARLARHGDVAAHHLAELSADHQAEPRAAVFARGLG
jgi:hypothetical protein